MFFIFFRELLPRVELGTSSLPRMRSTTELKQQYVSGKRDSNPRPPAWKASALSTELFPQNWPQPTLRESLCRRLAKPSFASLAKDFRIKFCGCGWIRTTEVERQQIYSLPHLATLEHTHISNGLARKNVRVHIKVAAVIPVKINFVKLILQY